MTKQKQSKLNHVIARWQATHQIELCEFANMRAERRNRHVGEIQRLCDYDVANAPRNDENSGNAGRALTNSCSSLRSHNCILSKQGEELCDQFPLQAESVRVCPNNSGTSQSLIDVKNLTSYRLNVLTTSKKVAFTLAEVLITLGVIGIVAAMTIPTLVNSYQEKVTVTRLKKTYSVINQAFKLMVMDYGTVDEWGLAKTETDDGAGNPVYDYSGSKLFMERLSKYLKHEALKAGEPITDKTYSLDGTITRSAPTVADEGAIQLADGTILNPGFIMSSDCSFYGTNENQKRCGDLWVVFPKKKSMTVGVNGFMFYITKNGITPVGTTDKNDGGFITFCNMKSTIGTNNGRGCAAWVIQNGNMDYLHCDDLSWDGKHKCSD